MRYLFITGVSRGLGKAIASVYQEPDTKVVGFGRSKGDFAGTFHTCDFTKPQVAASIFKDALADEPLEEASEILFVSNAGVLGPLTQAQNLDAYDIERTVGANICGTAVAAAAFLARANDLPIPKLFAQISSGAALPDRAKASWSLYCASKSGQEQLVRSIAEEQKTATHPTLFINVNPGVMETAMQEQIRQVPSDQFPDVARFIKLKEDGKVPPPEVIAVRIKDLMAQTAKLENGKTYDVSK